MSNLVGVTAAKMAAQFNRADVISPKRSSLEEDDGCHFYPSSSGLAKQNLMSGVGLDVCDSGVSMTSFGCEAVTSLGVSEPLKPPVTDHQACVSVGYTSFGGPEDILEGPMEGLTITCSSSETTTTTANSMETTVFPTTEPVDPRRAFVDRLQLCFTPDIDGDTYVTLI